MYEFILFKPLGIRLKKQESNSDSSSNKIEKTKQGVGE